MKNPPICASERGGAGALKAYLSAAGKFSTALTWHLKHCTDLGKFAVNKENSGIESLSNRRFALI
jgi:hypothetical protein